MRVVGHVYTMEKITLFAHLWHVSLLCNKQIIDYVINIGSSTTISLKYDITTCIPFNVKYFLSSISSSISVSKARDKLIDRVPWQYTIMIIPSSNLFLGVRKDSVRSTTGAIYSWAFFVTSICIMDLVGGVIFGVDFSRFHNEASKYNANSLNAGPVDPNAAQLVFGGVAAISMMIISFKGFILWFINLGTLIYLLHRAVRISQDKNDTVSKIVGWHNVIVSALE